MAIARLTRAVCPLVSEAGVGSRLPRLAPGFVVALEGLGWLQPEGVCSALALGSKQLLVCGREGSSADGCPCIPAPQQLGAAQPRPPAACVEVRVRAVVLG